MAHRNEEPMDILAINQKQTSSMNILTRQLDKMNSKLAKMEIQFQQGLTHRQPRRHGKASSWAQGKILCYNCNAPGHISRNCPKKIKPAHSEPMDVSPIPLTAGLDQENC